MSLPTSTLTTNELKLHDFKGTKASITFGDADINDGYSYLNMNFRANDHKFDFYQDKPVINFIASEEITFNDKKIWHENNDGPMSGLNADMLDGLHASEFKDRNGHNHFGHAFIPGGSKRFVKIATFTPRRVGNSPDFNTSGSNPFEGVFADNIVKRMNARAKFNAFVEDTPERLGPIGVNGFEHTDMASEGVYNSTLRASISILRKGDTKNPPWQGAETVDVHVGIFEDPTNNDENGWSCTSRYFYVSSHERNLPFIKEPDDPRHDWEVGNNVMPVADYSEVVAMSDNNNEEVEVLTKTKKRKSKSTIETVEESKEARNSLIPKHSCPVSIPGHDHTDSDHKRPEVDYSDYAEPPDSTKNYYKAQKFPDTIPPGFSYQKELESFRLYHVDSHVETVDGVNVVTHQFDLYMVVDTKMEVHVQPYMSSSCLFYNYQKPISEGELPNGPYMRPLSVYDNRYAHVEHRHRNYEEKIERIDEEIEEMWQSFDGYVAIHQGQENANKVLMTNSSGKVVAVVDNIERHQDDRRYKRRVLVTNDDGCIVESWIQTKELAQLKDVRANIQHQIDELFAGLQAVPPPPEIPDVSGYVKKIGDTMTGDLYMTNNGEFKIYKDAAKTPQFGMHMHTKNGYSGFHDVYENTVIAGLRNDTTDTNDRIFYVNKKSFAVGGAPGKGGAKITVSSTAPTNPRVGDVWIKNG